MRIAKIINIFWDIKHSIPQSLVLIKFIIMFTIIKVYTIYEIIVFVKILCLVLVL